MCSRDDDPTQHEPTCNWQVFLGWRSGFIYCGKPAKWANGPWMVCPAHKGQLTKAANHYADAPGSIHQLKGQWQHV